ncbi:MAG: hypothetical protein Q8O67_16225 [Deltaproteobacteria bacterium]|nr:hypothetical protein [Deltaproteobacteria bacterium]
MLVANMREYFRESLQRSLKESGTQLTETAQVYIVNLLAEFARTENVYAGTDRGERPVLVELMARAQESDPVEALRIYKHMGDSSLYLTGFFKDSMNDAAVSVDYYVSMGGTAYDAVARLMRPTAATSSALFSELACRFPDLVELLCAMSLHGERSRKLDDGAVLGLVDRYRRTGSREVLSALKSQGVVLRPGLDDDDDLVH